jgi:chaperonin GroEL|tara:strand:+ start:2591 stop:4252 length:1662 start_codon:yes stop_codon:yes gene_type:complete
MSKSITFNHAARQGLSDGIEKLAQAVISTLGPSGRNVIIESAMGNPQSTKDGVTVAKSIDLEDKLENIGAQLVKQASIKTAEQAGDGTTTSTLLARELYNKGLGTIGDYNAVEVQRGILKGTKVIVEYLENLSKDITDEEQLKQVATISANSDKEVGELIATSMEKVGRDGVVTIEESKTGETYLETVEGMQFNRGYKSPYFVTDNPSMTAVLQSPYVLIVDKRLSSIKELLPVLEAVQVQNKSLLLIADDLDGEALSTLVVNKMRGILPAVAVKAPDFGDRKKAILEDIAIMTGAQVISSEKGMRLDRFDPKWLGKAGKVTVSKDITTIIDAKGEDAAITARVEEIKTQIDEANSPFEIENLQARLAKFIGGVAVVHVGGHTEIEMKEKKDRVDDALHATKAALEEGILPGGGIALLNSALDLTKQRGKGKFKDFTVSELIGLDILTEALTTPFTQILWNAGVEPEKVAEIKEVVEGKKNQWYGYNSRFEEYTDMLKAGIIDPTKVTRLALENAASVAATMLTTEAVVSIDPPKDGEPAGMPGGIDPAMLMG